MAEQGRQTVPGADDFSGVDFVPEEESWAVDTGSDSWRESTGQDMDETVVLEPLDRYEPGEQRRQILRDDGMSWETENEWEDAAEWEEENPGKKYSKYGKDPYDVPEEPVRRRKTVYEEEVVKKKKKKGTVKAVGKTAGRMLPFVLRLVSLLAMGIIEIRLVYRLWAQKDTLGAVSQMVAEKNYGSALYLCLAVFILAYGALSMLWILTRRRMAYEGRLRRYDTGRGLTAFVIFVLLTFLASRTALYMPAAPHVLSGLGLFFLVLASLQGTIYMCSLVGIACCIIRKIMKY